MNTMTTTLRPRAERRSGAVQPGPCTTSPDRVLGSGPMDKGTIVTARMINASSIRRTRKTGSFRAAIATAKRRWPRGVKPGISTPFTSRR